jgi:hypothetical protein
VGAAVHTGQFFHSYLLAFVVYLSLALGSLALLMLHYLTGGMWGLAIRRMLEACSRTLPLMPVLALPLLFGLSENYPWARQGEAHDNEAHAIYFSMPFFLGRAALYFAIWLLIMYLLNTWSAAHDSTGDVALSRKAQQFSGPGLVLYGLTVTFSAIDWVMSLDDHWSSTIFGPIIAMGQMLPAIAFAIAVCTLLAARQPLAGIATPDLWNDLGNLLLAFVMLWTYMAFSQFLLIWSGNLPEEITWYLARSEGGWQWIAIALALFGFAFPFLMLLSRDMKRNPTRLRFVALAVVAMGLVNDFWLIAPAFSRGSFWLDWMDVAAVVGMGGVWLGVFVWEVQKRPILPVHADAPEEEVLDHA